MTLTNSLIFFSLTSIVPSYHFPYWNIEINLLAFHIPHFQFGIANLPTPSYCLLSRTLLPSLTAWGNNNKIENEHFTCRAEKDLNQQLFILKDTPCTTYRTSYYLLLKWVKKKKEILWVAKSGVHIFIWSLYLVPIHYHLSTITYHLSLRYLLSMSF